MTTPDRFAILRERLDSASKQQDAFVDLMDFVSVWPAEEDQDLAIAYTASHLFANPSNKSWAHLCRSWRHAFGNKEMWFRQEAAQRAKSEPLQRLSTALLAHLADWADETKSFTRYRPQHPLWPVARSLRLMKLHGFTALDACQHFTHLVIRRDTLLEDERFPLFKELTNLRTVVCRLSGAENLRGIGTLTQIEHLDLTSCYNISSLAGFEGMEWLQTLNLQRCEKLVYLYGISQLPNLSWLDVSGCPNLPITPDDPVMTTREEVTAYLNKLG